MEKMTNVKALDYVLANTTLPTDVVEKLEKMKIQFEKKNGSEKKPTATQLENATLKTEIVSAMEADKAYTVSELMKLVPALDGLTNQRVSAIVKQMVDANVLAREEIKRKAYFSLVTE